MKRGQVSWKIVGACVLVAMVSACAKPQTARPTLNQGALNDEMGVQKQIAQQSSPDGNTAQANIDSTALQGMNGRLQSHGERVRNAGMKLCQVTGRDPNSCVYSFHLKNENALNAYADGSKIYVTPVMMRFAANDDMLAMVLSHEYAHNIMGHVASKQQNALAGMLLGTGLDVLARSQGFDTGGKLSNIGASQGANAYSPAFESEADYVGLYVMYYAGYDISNAAGLWRNMTAAAPSGALITTSHPANPERYVLLNQTKDEILAKRASGQAVVPNMKQKK